MKLLQNKLMAMAILLCFAVGLNAADVITGDPNAAAGQSFSFPVLAHDQNVRAGTFYVGALANGAGSFSISRFVRTGKCNFVSFTPQKTKVNNQDNQQNPLFNKGVTFLRGLLNQERIAAVINDDLTSVFVIDDIWNASVISLLNVKDASGQNATSAIVGIAGGKTVLIFAGVRPNGGGNFGVTGSGIALLGITTVDDQGNATKDHSLIQLDVQPGIPPNPTDLRAAAFDVSTPAVQIVSNLTSIENVVDMYFDPVLQRLFIAIQGQSGAGATDGLRAVAIGRLDQSNKLFFEPIAPDAAFSGALNKIIGGVGANVEVSIHKVRVMHTSTSLPYLIVQGGNGSPVATQRSVFALPLTDFRDNNSVVTNQKQQGTIAAQDDCPQDRFSNSCVPAFIGRQFRTPATTAADLLTDSDVAAQVGGGPIGVGDIADMFVRGDSVFVAIGDPADANQKTGIFYSQALFDEKGRIERWTQWRRVAGTTDQIFGAALDPCDGSFIYLTGPDVNNVRTVKKTIWGQGAQNGLEPVSTLLEQQFPQDCAGLQCLLDFISTPAITGSEALDNISLLIATGFEKIALVETGFVQNNVLCPNAGLAFNRTISFPNGSITQNLPTQPAPNDEKVVIISGGALAEIGPIVAATVGIDSLSDNGYLFVGGSCGLAVLSDSAGDGWDTTIGLGAGFEGLVQGMSFKKVGTYTLVRKLISDGDFLYVMTDKQLDRIDMTEDNIGLNEFIPVTLATLSDFADPCCTGSFCDFLVSEKLGLLATTVGLFRIGNNKDVRTITSFTNADWQSVTLPESILPVSKLIPFSTTGVSFDVARNGGGNLYVLEADQGNNRARMHRFTIADTSTGPITDTTLQVFPDIHVQGIPSYFTSFGEFINRFAYDGAILLSAIDRDECDPPQLKIGTRSNAKEISLCFDTCPVNASNIVRILRSFASGSWLVAGDYGLRINE